MTCFRHPQKKSCIAMGSINFVWRDVKGVPPPVTLSFWTISWNVWRHPVIWSACLSKVSIIYISVCYASTKLCTAKESTINLNNHIYVLMKNPRGVSQLQCMARQAFLVEAPFSWRPIRMPPPSLMAIWSNFSPGAEEAYHVHTRVYDRDDNIIYLPT